MKRAFLYSAAALTLLSACGEDFLDKTPTLETSESSIFQSESKLEAAVEGVYYRLKSGYFLGGYATLAGDNRSDDMCNYGSNGYTLRDCYNHAVNASSIENDYLYYRAYLGINYANTLIDCLEDTYADSWPCDATTGNRYIQELKVMRALSYYYLSSLFGLPYNYNSSATNVPLRISAVTSAGENEMAGATIAEIYQQILADTQDISYLPTGYGDSDFSATKASQAAAHALRMRVYMAMNNWSAAISEAQAITGFSLISSIATMFETPYALTAENILSMPMTNSDKSGSQTHPAGYFSHVAGSITCLNEINGISVTYGIDADDRSQFIYDDGNNYLYYEKFDEYSTLLEWIPIFRYGEILLNMAECYYNLGDEDSARSCLKQVRTRSIAESVDPLVTYKETGSDLWTVIDNERRWELLGEGVRGYDIFRRAEDYRHPTTSGGWTVVATPSDKTSYCWAFPLYETTVNTALSN